MIASALQYGLGSYSESSGWGFFTSSHSTDSHRYKPPGRHQFLYFFPPLTNQFPASPGVIQRKNIMFKLSSNKRPTGKVWDHEGKTEVLQIFISHGGGIINCLQFLYVENGNLVMSERLGGSDHGRNFNTVTLNYPDEFLTSISGSSTTGYTNRVSSITFGTNQGSHGPFGKPGTDDMKFNFQLGKYRPFGKPGKDDMKFNFQLGKYRPFGGFHGSTTSDGYLESIGVYVKPIASLSDLNSAGKVKRENLEFHA